MVRLNFPGTVHLTRIGSMVGDLLAIHRTAWKLAHQCTRHIAILVKLAIVYREVDDPSDPRPATR